ncbi:hypothetical protein BFF98_02805 [Corynebacterium pseudotuberculosis]|nr:hypothetical protein BFF98_02805 [Corynebacterium pseudotuberculosis]
MLHGQLCLVHPFVLRRSAHMLPSLPTPPEPLRHIELIPGINQVRIPVIAAAMEAASNWLICGAAKNNPMHTAVMATQNSTMRRICRRPELLAFSAQGCVGKRFFASVLILRAVFCAGAMVEKSMKIRPAPTMMRSPNTAPKASVAQEKVIDKRSDQLRGKPWVGSTSG